MQIKNLEMGGEDLPGEKYDKAIVIKMLNDSERKEEKKNWFYD